MDANCGEAFVLNPGDACRAGSPGQADVYLGCRPHLQQLDGTVSPEELQAVLSLLSD